MSMDGPGAPAERRWGLRERARLLAPATALVVLVAGATTLLLARIPARVERGAGAGTGRVRGRGGCPVPATGQPGPGDPEPDRRDRGRHRRGCGISRHRPPGGAGGTPGKRHPSVLLGDAGTEAVCIDTGGGGMARMERVQALGRGVNLSVHDGGVFSSGRCLHPTHPPSHAPCAMTDAKSLSSMDGQVAPTASRVSIRTIDRRSVHASVGGWLLPGLVAFGLPGREHHRLRP
jgi:hypothetical protein